MKEKQNKRRRLKLVSFLCAFLVWLAVVNVADPVMSDSVEVPIEIVNGHVLEESGLAYEIMGKKTTTISYEVNTTNAYRIRSSDFRAYVDLTELWSVTGSVPVKIEVKNNAELLKSTPVSKTSTIKIDTEPVQVKRFELNTILTGEVVEGHKAGDVTLAPKYVYLEGPESLIGQVSSAGIEISVDDMTDDTTGNSKIRYYDANGNKINLNERIEANAEFVDYDLQILQIKNIGLEFAVTGQVADRFRFTGIDAERSNIEVVGAKEDLASMNTLTISGDVLNIEEANGPIEKTIKLSEYLPEGVTLAENENEDLLVLLIVERLEDRVYSIEVNETCLVGQVEGLIYEPEPDSINVRVRALPEELEVLSLDTSDIEIDVSRMRLGTNGATVVLKTELDEIYEVIYVTICNMNVTEEVIGPGEFMTEDVPISPDMPAGQEDSTTAKGN